MQTAMIQKRENLKFILQYGRDQDKEKCSCAPMSFIKGDPDPTWPCRTPFRESVEAGQDTYLYLDYTI